MGSGCLTLNAGSSSSGYCRCCRRLKRHALCGTSLAASCCGSLCRSKHSPQCHRQICCCLSARSWPLAVHQCQRRARGSRYRRRRHNSRRSHAPSSSGAQQTTRRSTRSTRTEPARNWSTQSTLPVAVRGGPPVPARQPLSARAVSSWSDVAQTLSVCAAKVQVRRVAELRVNATGAVQLMLHPYLRQLRGTKLA